MILYSKKKSNLQVHGSEFPIGSRHRYECWWWVWLCVIFTLIVICHRETGQEGASACTTSRKRCDTMISICHLLSLSWCSQRWVCLLWVNGDRSDGGGKWSVQAQDWFLTWSSSSKVILRLLLPPTPQSTAWKILCPFVELQLDPDVISGLVSSSMSCASWWGGLMFTVRSKSLGWAFSVDTKSVRDEAMRKVK